MDSRATFKLTAAPAQCATAALMLRPAAFGFNTETAASNAFQQQTQATDAALRARDEFDAMVGQLRAAGLRVCVVEDDPLPPRPDAVFPNNWVSFHTDGTVVLYPMLTPNRRAERRPEVLTQIAADLGFIETRRIDLTHHETAGRFLEGTGSLVLDAVNRVAYANRSARTDQSLVREWCQLMGYEAVIFDAATPDGRPVYHTNVLLWIGARAAGVGLEWIAAADRQRVLHKLQSSGRTVLALPPDSLQHFAGNMLELRTGAQDDAKHVLVLSAQAAQSLPAALRQQLEACTDQLCVVPIPLIEQLGGGSVRCMLAEVPT